MVRILKVGGAFVLMGAGAYGAMAVVQWILNNPTVQVALILMAEFVALAGAFLAGQWWAERQIRMGASIATTAQQIDNAADVRKTNALAAIFRVGVQAGQQVSKSASNTPALPVPQQVQGGGWLPALTEFAGRDEPDPEVWGDVLDGEVTRD
jgi:hypothetical protein